MANTPHELVADFPELADRIQDLKTSAPHFAKLMDDYHELNRRVHRAETMVEPIEELAEMQLRKERANLKDQLYQMMTADA